MHCQTNGDVTVQGNSGGSDHYDLAKVLEEIIAKGISLYMCICSADDCTWDTVHRDLLDVLEHYFRSSSQRKGGECGFYLLYYINLFLQNDPTDNFSFSSGHPHHFMKEGRLVQSCRN